MDSARVGSEMIN